MLLVLAEIICQLGFADYLALKVLHNTFLCKSNFSSKLMLP